MSDLHHAEWLSLLDVSGPFLSPPVLERVFPQGLDAPDADHAGKLRLAFEEWADEGQKPLPDPAIHDEWVRLVLTETLGFTPEVLFEGGAIPDDLALRLPEHGEVLRPGFVVFDPEGEPGVRKPQLLISVYERGQELDQVVVGSRWAASPGERMVQLCRANQIRLGLVTNGERWMLVDAPEGETSGLASWYASLWSPEPLTLRAFRSLLGLRRFFGVAAADRLVAMLAESATFQAEVTDQLGAQVRRAVEVLVQALDRADADTGRTLLRDVPESRLYEAALTVMMRLVFLFSAEERDLLLLGDPVYDQNYAVSTLRAQLREAADRVSEQVLENRYDAWSRLLAAFRAIYGGVDHESLHLRAYGSSLFDPDRFPFLEGRLPDSIWTETEAEPLPIDNRTVLLLLESLQMLDLGKSRGARKLSFRALDIEQIGHVYETLLDHTAVRASEPMISLLGNQRLEPEIPVSRLHNLILEESDDKLIGFLKAELKKGEATLRKSLQKTPNPEFMARLRAACGDDLLLAKVLPFHDLIRVDPWGDPVVIRVGAVFATAGEDRRSTGTHYTPRALTEEIVRYALEPVVYRGPAEGRERDEWELKRPAEILDLKVCDPAMGSGAFLVQACRYLSERLVEAWDHVEHDGPIEPEGNPATPADAIPSDRDDQLVLARRLIADRCLYGVDINPLAVEMAKLSMWLITLARDTPFGFLDHALKCGDSLLGVHDLDQIRHFHPDPEKGRRLHHTLFDPTPHIEDAITRALDLRKELETFVVRDIHDERHKRSLHEEAERALRTARQVGDVVIAAALATTHGTDPGTDAVLSQFADSLGAWLATEEAESGERFAEEAESLLNAGKPIGKARRRPFHWPIEYPEVFERGRAGFDALVMNPPFLGGKRISGPYGTDYREYLVRHVGRGKKGNADLCAFFFLRVAQLLSRSGAFGSLATNTIAQGDTREVGLDQIVAGGATIIRAEPSRPWPGLATLEIAQLWVASDWSGSIYLGGERVLAIAPTLFVQGRTSGNPYRLGANRRQAFIGSLLNGSGFIVSKAEAADVLARFPRAADVLIPYLTGMDLNNTPDQSPTRYVIDFHDWPLEKAREYGPCFDIVLERVKPQRSKLPDSKRRVRETWWRYEHAAPSLYRTISGLERVIATSRVSKTVQPAFVPTGLVYSDAVVVFAFDDYARFGLLNSSFNWWWVSTRASTLRTDIRYNPTDCYETMPFPADLAGPLEAAGRELDETRQALLDRTREGLTPLYGRYHDLQDLSDLDDVRQAHIQLDQAVARSYGWSDIELGNGFYQTPWGMRFTLSPAARVEVLDRLLELNHAMHNIEDQ